MNLYNSLVEQLKQDEWSLGLPTYGPLTVVGWSGRNNHSSKFYVLTCKVCSSDLELFGNGYFKMIKEHIVRGHLPCGCGRNPRWDENQYAVLCRRKAEQLGYSFLGFQGEWMQQRTLVNILCEKHGEWCTGNISNLLHSENGCPDCRIETLSTLNTKPDSVMIESFFASGGFHPETKFWRSERKTSQGYGTYWHIYCPECNEQGESTSGHLQEGKRPCGCSNSRQQEAYINYVVNQGVLVAIKFGIARNSLTRVKDQNRKSTHTVQMHLVYEFPDVASCRRAELACKREFECGIISKEHMSDGYTETTHPHNLEKIIEIYERNGGIRIND